MNEVFALVTVSQLNTGGYNAVPQLLSQPMARIIDFTFVIDAIRYNVYVQLDKVSKTHGNEAYRAAQQTALTTLPAMATATPTPTTTDTPLSPQSPTRSRRTS
jgi:hypothetical protein